MSDYTMTLYRGHAQDADAVMGFLSEISLHPRYLAEYHIGDFVWQGYRDDPTPWLDRIAIWRDGAGQIVAIGWFEGQNEVADVIHPGLDQDAHAELFAQIVAWGEERRRALGGDNPAPLGVTALQEEPETHPLLEALGFRFSGELWFAWHAQELDGPIPEPVLPEGYEIVEMTDAADLVDRVEIHREVWAPSKFTHEGYQLLRAAPVYRQDLDLAVRAPDGRYASYLIAWLDPEARTGLFEPVGARSEYRRLGLTRALIYETLRRLKDLGATRAYVGSVAAEGPARALYRAAGFTTIAHWQWWQRPTET
jgi:mycothiol synthase